MTKPVSAAIPSASPEVPPKSRRGRPSAARVGAIDRTIVQTARRMFLADGFDAVAMEQVAALADVSKGTLYARYASKEALFTAVIQASVRDWSDEAAQHDDELTENIEQRLRHHARTIAASLQRPDVIALQRLILSIRSRFPEFARAIHDAGYDYIVELIMADIVAASERDGIPARDPRGVARMLVAGMTGVQLQEEWDAGDSDALDAFAQRLVDVIVAGRAAW
jgi:TetR/AcrR family transcriptional regulator, mexJK operon transcriptional repressor